MEDVKQPIVVKKIMVGHGHHGGSWKLAFGGMATAMMAFFMVLWLVGQTDGEQRGGISEYFHNPTMIKGASEAATGAAGKGGASLSLIQLGGAFEPPKKLTVNTSKSIQDKKASLVKQLELLQEIKRLDTILKNLRETLLKNSTLRPYKNQFVMNIIQEGLRIQIIDAKDRPMFDSGSAHLKPYTAEILYAIARNIQNIPNHISITGHTDSSPYTARRNYSNWELSADRANAARQALSIGGLQEDRIGRVVGLADSIPYNPTDPLAPSNRRINIVVMNRSAYEAMAVGEAPPQKTTHALATEETGEKKPNVIYDPGKSTYENIRVEEIQVVDPLQLEAQKPFRESILYAEEPKPEVIPAALPIKETSPDKETRINKKEPRKADNVVKKPIPIKPVIDLPPIINPSLIPGSPVEK